MSHKVTVGYILRETSGAEKFSQAYFAKDAGIEHELLLINKGAKYDKASESKKLLTLCDRIQYVSDYALAMRAHRLAMIYCNTEYYCGLSSWSRPLVNGWLKKLIDAATIPYVGFVSCTGSYETFANKSSGNLFRRLFRFLLWPKGINPHLRLTGFCGKTETLLKYWPTVFFNKVLDEWHEHGRNSISRRMIKDHLSLLVVSTNNIYHVNKWTQSNTFRASQQEHLLIADKQTDIYARQHYALS